MGRWLDVQGISGLSVVDQRGRVQGCQVRRQKVESGWLRVEWKAARPAWRRPKPEVRNPRAEVPPPLKLRRDKGGVGWIVRPGRGFGNQKQVQWSRLGWAISHRKWAGPGKFQEQKQGA